MKRLSVVLAVVGSVAMSMLPGTAQAASIYSLQVSTSATRSAPVALQGSTLTGSVYVFVAPATGARKVRFYVDNPAATGTPRQTEASAPWDLAGTAKNGTANAFNLSTLAAGTHTVTASIDLTGGGTDIVTSTFTVGSAPPPPPPPPPPPSSFSLQLSTAATRTSPVALQGSTVPATGYVFVSPATGATRVRFWLDNPAATGTPRQTEGLAPWDFAGTATSGDANPFAFSTLSAGAHSITAVVDKSAGGSDTITSTFTVGSTPPPPPPGTLAVSPASLAMNATPGGPAVNAGVTLTATGSTSAVWTATTSQPWLTVTPSGTGSGVLTVVADPAALAAGTFNGTVTVAATGYTSATVTVALTVAAAGTCTPVACSLIKVQRPYLLTFAEGGTGIVDKVGLGTGYTTYLRTGTGGGYVPANVALEPTGKGLQIQTTPGGVNTTENANDNMLGVGFDGTASTVIEVGLPGLPAGTGKFEQGGAWFGYTQDQVERIAVVSVVGGWQFEHTLETNGVIGSKSTSAVQVIDTTTPVSMRILTNPTTLVDTAYYKIGAGAWTALGAFAVPGAFYSFDAAGIDPAIATRSFAGTWASSRQATIRPVFTFNSFSLADAASTPPAASDLAFDRVSAAVPFPTSIVQGPDGKLYVTTLMGTIHVLTLGADGSITNDQAVTTLGSRLPLGIAIDPASTPDNVIVWVAHSSPSATSGLPNTGTVTRLSGPGLTQATDVITGLPRSYSNHSVNSLRFGPDGRLYLAIGGNTGAGAPNTANSEFGTMAEQALSAAVVVADVASPTFDGTCNPGSDVSTPGAGFYGPAPCDVTVYADGLRNTYDFVFASNGKMYGTDNGLGVVGSYPPSTTAPCFGDGSTASYTTGGNNPGAQPDELNLIEPGKYYGHPNPVRNECVFGDGHWQGVPALPNYTPAIANLGMDKSADGITEYRGQAFCGVLDKNLLIANYSVGKDITRVVLSADGRSVVSQTQLASGFLDPLPITVTSQGWIVVGETGGAGKITVLKPREAGCWSTSTAHPQALVGAGSASIGSTMYVVGGAASTGRVNSFTAFDSTNGTWATLPDKPGTPVESPAVVAWNGKVYVVGGNASQYQGGVAEVWVYDPGTTQWSALPSLASRRGAPGAALIGSTLYVIGGLAPDGSSQSSVEALDLANPVAWGSAPSLGTARDHMAVATVGTTIYVFGGRTRLADGTEPNGTALATVEALAAGDLSWSARAAMPTARRDMSAVTLGGAIHVIGGQLSAASSSFGQNERYDPVANTWTSLVALPTPRHGMAAAVLSGAVHLVGGSTTGGYAYGSVHETFTPAP